MLENGNNDLFCVSVWMCFDCKKKFLIFNFKVSLLIHLKIDKTTFRLNDCRRNDLVHRKYMFFKTSNLSSNKMHAATLSITALRLTTIRIMALRIRIIRIATLKITTHK